MYDFIIFQMPLFSIKIYANFNSNSTMQKKLLSIGRKIDATMHSFKNTSSAINKRILIELTNKILLRLALYKIKCFSLSLRVKYMTRQQSSKKASHFVVKLKYWNFFFFTCSANTISCTNNIISKQASTRWLSSSSWIFYTYTQRLKISRRYNCEANSGTFFKGMSRHSDFITEEFYYVDSFSSRKPQKTKKNISVSMVNLLISSSFNGMSLPKI